MLSVSILSWQDLRPVSFPSCYGNFKDPLAWDKWFKNASEVTPSTTLLVNNLHYLNGRNPAGNYRRLTFRRWVGEHDHNDEQINWTVLLIRGTVSWSPEVWKPKTCYSMDEGGKSIILSFVMCCKMQFITLRIIVTSPYRYISYRLHILFNKTLLSFNARLQLAFDWRPMHATVVSKFLINF